MRNQRGSGAGDEGEGEKAFPEKANKKIQREGGGTENEAVTGKENALLVGTRRQ